MVVKLGIVILWAVFTLQSVCKGLLKTSEEASCTVWKRDEGPSIVRLSGVQLRTLFWIAGGRGLCRLELYWSSGSAFVISISYNLLFGCMPTKEGSSQHWILQILVLYNGCSSMKQLKEEQALCVKGVDWITCFLGEWWHCFHDPFSQQQELKALLLQSQELNSVWRPIPLNSWCIGALV